MIQLCLAVGFLLLLVVLVGPRRPTATYRPAARPTEPSPDARAVVVTGSYGAGHDAAAARIADHLRRRGVEVDVLDVVNAYPARTGLALKRLYFAQLSVCPRSWGWVLEAMSVERRGGRWLAEVARTATGLLGERRLRSMIGETPALVVSTHPFASAALGRMRRRGSLTCPAVTYLTDPSVHALWVHRGIDIHLAVYEQAATQARALGATRVETVRPLAPDHRAEPRTPRVVVRTALGVPNGSPLLLVVGGSEGVGDLLATTEDLLATGLGTPVVVCGHNDHLRQQVAALPGAVALGWQDGLGDLVVAADCVVQNAGGFTALESVASGTPVVSYRCLPGHGSDNAAALDTDALAPWARTPQALVDALTDALVTRRDRPSPWVDRPRLGDVLAPRTIGASSPAAGLSAPVAALAVNR